MKQSIKPFVLGLAFGVGALYTIASAGQGVKLLPNETLVINRQNQPLPVVATQPVTVITDPKTPLRVTTDAPTRKTFEYRVYETDEAMMNAQRVPNVEQALNRIGAEGWEMIAPRTFKRQKN